MQAEIITEVEFMLRDHSSNDAGNDFIKMFDNQHGCEYNNENDAITELNRFWRRQLARISKTTVSERSCLVDNIDSRDWIRHFKNTVLPTIVQYELPK